MRNYFLWVATSPWHADTLTVWGTAAGSEHDLRGVSCPLQPMHLPSTSSSPHPATTSLHCPTSFFVPFASGSLVFILSVRLLHTALLNPSLKFIFVQWSNFFTHHISTGYKRSGYFSKSWDILPKPIFLSLSIQEVYSPQHGGHSCDWAVTNQTSVMVPWDSETHIRRGKALTLLVALPPSTSRSILIITSHV